MASQAKIIEGVKEIIQDTAFTSTRILDYLNMGVRQIAGGLLLQYPDRTQVASSPLPELQTDNDLTTSITLPYIDMPSDFGRNLVSLVSATNSIGIEVMGSLAELLRYYPELNNTGRVVSAAIRGKRLYYQGMPGTAETLTTFYYRTPYDMVTLTGGSDITFTATTLRIADAGNGLGVFHAGQTIDVTGTTSNNTSFVISSVESDGSYLTTTVAPVLEANQSATIKSRPDGIPVFLQEALLENFAAWKIFERKTKNDSPMEAEAKRYHGLFLGSMLNLEQSIENVPEPFRFLNDTGY